MIPEKNVDEQKRYWNALADAGVEAAVIDPFDRRGHKNSYIISSRTREILTQLQTLPASATILDFGCGTGNLTRALAGHGWKVIGLDIAEDLLATGRNVKSGGDWVLTCYDGLNLPLANASIDAATTYVVLNHVIDDQHFATILRELHRVLKPGGKLLAVEQVARTHTLTKDGNKLQRPRSEFIRGMQAAGFVVESHRIIRFGHFLPIYLVRYGLMPRVLNNMLFAVERMLGRLYAGNPVMDYADVAFVAVKQ